MHRCKIFSIQKNELKLLVFVKFFFLFCLFFFFLIFTSEAILGLYTKVKLKIDFFFFVLCTRKFFFSPLFKKGKKKHLVLMGFFFEQKGKPSTKISSVPPFPNPQKKKKKYISPMR